MKREIHVTKASTIKTSRELRETQQLRALRDVGAKRNDWRSPDQSTTQGKLERRDQNMKKHRGNRVSVNNEGHYSGLITRQEHAEYADAPGVSDKK